MENPLTRNIGFVLFDHFNALDIVGPLEVFALANEFANAGYLTQLVGLQQRAYLSESGIQISADTSFAASGAFDTLIIPGGAGGRRGDIERDYVPWLHHQLTHTRRMVSVCTGAFLLAATGALDNKKATTHWNHAEEFKRKYPKVNLSDDAIYIEQDNIATSAGITTGIDLALKLVENDHGSKLAVEIARFLVVPYRRIGSQSQFSAPLQYQQRAGQEFQDLLDWVLQNLHAELSLELMADKVNMSVRNFCRKFKQQVGDPPAKFVETLRLDQARHILLNSQLSIQQVAVLTGYQQVDVFRRAFERKFLISPKQYRASFSHQI